MWRILAEAFEVKLTTLVQGWKVDYLGVLNCILPAPKLASCPLFTTLFRKGLVPEIFDEIRFVTSSRLNCQRPSGYQQRPSGYQQRPSNNYQKPSCCGQGPQMSWPLDLGLGFSLTFWSLSTVLWSLPMWTGSTITKSVSKSTSGVTRNVQHRGDCYMI